MLNHTPIVTRAARLGAIRSAPVAIPAGATTVSVVASLDAPDIVTVGHTTTITLLWSFDGVTYAHGASCTWEGGPRKAPRINGTPLPPGFRVAVPPGAQSYQVELTPSDGLAIGAGVAHFDAQGAQLA